MNTILISLCLLQAPTEPLRQQEQTVAMHRAGLAVRYDTQSTELSPYLKLVKTRRMEDRFNKLVQAVEDFSRAYNGSAGQVWPADKAAALRKAMHELQKSDPAFDPKADPKTSAQR
jgi:hypothetical protein